MTPSFERDAPDDPQAPFQVLFAHNPLPTWVCDRDTQQFLEVNAAAIAEYGYSRDEFLAMTLGDLVPPADDRRPADVGQAGASSSTATGRQRHRYKDGRSVDVEVSAHPLTFRGHPAVLVVARNLSRRDRELRHLVQSQKMDAIGRFAGTIAHDFNNVLTTITGYCDLILDDPALPAAIREDIDEMKQAAGGAAVLTRQLLAFHRRRSGSPEVLDVNDALARLRGKVQGLMGADVDVVMRLAPALRPMRLEPAQLEQIIVTLAANAREAMPGGGRFTIETANVAAAQSTGEHIPITAAECVRLTVSDTGTGMSAETLAHVFEPFFTTKASGGSGLGLATVYAIIRQNQGEVLADSEPGRGTTFTIDFPALAADEMPSERARPAPSAEAPAAVGGGETILVVEDDERLRLLAEKSLKRFGYTVLLCGGAAEALEMASQQGRIDLLMTDVMLPGMNGGELAQQFASRYPSAKVLFCSGYTADAIAQRAIIIPGAHLLQKPYTPLGLAEKVRQVLDGQTDRARQ